jgi:omega-6 fatty acid desaturase (delta-12 desaturase)
MMPHEASTPHAEHSTAREIRQTLPEGRRTRSNILALVIFAMNVVVYIATFILMFWPDVLAINLLFAVFNGMTIGTMFIVGHDACHGSFTSSSTLNKVLARLAFLPSLQPYTSWTYSHNGLHHGWTNLKGKDVVFVPYTMAEYRALHWSRRWMERVFRSPFGIALMYASQIWWKYEVFPKAEHAPKDKQTFFWDRLLVAGFLIVQIAVALVLSYEAEAPVWWWAGGAMGMLLLSYAAWFLLIAIITFQQHTHPEVPWYDNWEEWNFYRGQLHSTPHMEYPFWLHWLLHNVMDHNAHHVDPQIPMYQLTTSQRSLEQSYGEDIATSLGTIRQYLKTLRVCRLYDYEKHQWTDFDGTPTSPSGLNVLAQQVMPAGPSAIAG